jgi:hypothetical protein
MNSASTLYQIDLVLTECRIKHTPEGTLFGTSNQPCQTQLRSYVLNSPHFPSLKSSQPCQINITNTEIIAMDQEEQSCKKHDFFMQSTREAFMRTCLSCGFVEELQLSQGNRKVDPWQGWLSAKIQPLSRPPCIKYSGTLQVTSLQRTIDEMSSEKVYSYRPNMQTSLQSQPQMDVRLFWSHV